MCISTVSIEGKFSSAYHAKPIPQGVMWGRGREKGEQNT